ncbi:uncharacterized protein LODBEIA_P42980 [Lodderomyces beijingensis]|uniref:Uncharacterized protein n=1 Tax=Lodderomyces beijingensis TaxID=1775926 RepID=A0ABP0ZPK4_9ASCO
MLSITPLAPSPTRLAPRDNDDSNSPTGMPTISTQQDAIITVTTIPMRYNPYISNPTAPQGLVFIIVGAIIGFILLASLAYRIVTHFYYSAKAQREKETYFVNENPQHGFVDVLSNHYSFPHHRSHSALSLSTSSTSSQGKSLQSHLLSDKKQYRRPMFENPSLDYKKLDLSLGDLASGSMGSASTLYAHKNNSSVGSFMMMKQFAGGGATGGGGGGGKGEGDGLMPQISVNGIEMRDLESGAVSTVGSTTDASGNNHNGNGPPAAILRPPSLYLEDLLN